MYLNISLVLSIICMLISVVKLQRWAGTFAWNDQCKTNYCCCYAGTLSVVNSGSNLVFSSDAKGCSSSKTTSTFSNPNGYSFSTRGTRGAHVIYSLSSDSNTLTVRNDDYSYCGGSAKRTSSGEHVFPSIISLVIILASIWILL